MFLRRTGINILEKQHIREEQVKKRFQDEREKSGGYDDTEVFIGYGISNLLNR